MASTSEYTTYLYYDLLSKRGRVSRIAERVEGILLDHLARTTGAGVPAQQYLKVHNTFRDGSDVLRSLSQVHDHLQDFRRSLDSLLRILRPTEILSHDLQKRIQVVKALREKYDGVIAGLEQTMRKMFHDFRTIDPDTGTDAGMGTGMGTDADTIMFLKTEKARWENLVVIYLHFINGYQKVLTEVRGMNLEEISVVVAREVGETIKEFEQFATELAGADATLERAITEMTSVMNVRYDPTDLVTTATNPKVVTLEDAVKAYRMSVHFDDSLFVVKPENVDILDAVFSTTVHQMKSVSLKGINLELPQIEGRFVVKGAPSVAPAPVARTQSGGDLQLTAKRLTEFGIRLQETNLLLGEVRRRHETYVQLKIRLNHFLLYLMMIATSVSRREVSYYRSVNLVVVEHYLSIITEIDRQITVGERNRFSRYFDVYHYYTVKRLRRFLQFLVPYLADGVVIDALRSTGNVRESFVLFNHFKDIVDAYVEASAGSSGQKGETPKL